MDFEGPIFNPRNAYAANITRRPFQSVISSLSTGYESRLNFFFELFEPLKKMKTRKTSKNLLKSLEREKEINLLQISETSPFKSFASRAGGKR